MNILLFSRGVPTKRDAQWGSFEKDQAEALANLGHKVTVVAVDMRFRLFWRPLGITHCVQNGIDYYNYFLLPGAVVKLLFGKKIGERVKHLFYKRVVAKAVAQQGMPDVIYSHYLHISYHAAAFARGLRLPIVAIEHWSELNKDVLLPQVRAFGNSVYPQLDGLITVSGSLQKRLQEHFGVESQVIYNTIGNEFMQLLPTRERNEKMTFVSTGSLLYQKGFDLLIKAFDRLQLNRDSWQLNIIGEGEYRNTLQKMIDDAGLQQNIHLVGKKNKSEIVELLRASDVFFLASRSENFSVAVLEALSCGLPVIASICGGIRECIDEKNGLLFPVEDVDALAKSIETMIANIDTYNREQIAADCRARFAPNVIAKQIENVLINAIENSKTK